MGPPTKGLVFLLLILIFLLLVLGLLFIRALLGAVGVLRLPRLLGGAVHGSGREGGPVVLNHHRRRISSHGAALFHVLAQHQPRQEPADVRITGPRGILDLLLIDCDNGVLGDFVPDSHNRGLGALGENNNTRLGVLLLRKPRAFLRDVRDGGLRPSLPLGQRRGLGLVPEEDIHIRHKLHNHRGENGHLADEGSREVQAVGPVVRRAVLGHLPHGIRADGDEEPGAVHHPGALHDAPVGFLLHMVHLVVVGRCQFGHHRPVHPVDAHAADPGGGALVGHQDSPDPVLAARNA
mmetsp:Transcript_38335/g.83749  ORF Transcript_38335/g.83749 Transcript_38335/m.83749 type:complete len:293 (-) Transcript_38335:1271-2149(-)